MKLLIDGDILLYKCAFAAEKTHYLVVASAEEGGDLAVYFPNHKEALSYAEPLGLDIWSRKEIKPEEYAIQATNSSLQSILDKFGSPDYEIYLSADKTFRHRLGTTKPYKGHRTAPKPTHYKAVKDYLLNMGAIIREDLEADDCMSIEATKDPGYTVIVTIDKDLLQVPGNHYNWVTGEYVVQSKRKADICLASQLLTGDSTDNVPGLPKVGPAKAQAILKGARSPKELFERVFKTYEEVIGASLWEDYFIEQFSLIYLLREYGQEKIYEGPPDEVAKQVRSQMQGAA